MKELCCEIDCARVTRNIIELGKPVVLMAKADCYGLGLAVTKAVEPWVAAYGVAYGQEGCELRAMTDKPIVVTTPVWTRDDVTEFALTPCVQSLEEVKRLRDVQRACAVHIALNTGMNRFGLSTPLEVRAVRKAIESNPNLFIAGACTHYASALRYAEQNKRLQTLLRELPKGICVHTQASSTAKMRGYDLLRVGMRAYADSVRLLSRVIAVRYVARGQAVGYDGVYVPTSSRWIAIVAGGYADGVSKALRGHLVNVGGRLYPIAAVCMDVCMVAMDRPCQIGDEVCILGDTPYPKRSTLYEMYTAIGSRYERIYKGVS